MTVPPAVAHVVVTRSFAGVERYVCDVSNETSARGWDTFVVGGDPTRMQEALVKGVRWLPGENVPRAFWSLTRVGRLEICHAHLTKAETVALAGRRSHRAPVIVTRHVATRRGRSRLGAVLAPWISSRLARQIATSEFASRGLERAADAVIPNGVPASPLLWNASSRIVLVLQRLEAEKQTLTALQAWQESRLADAGWALRIVGDGAERGVLERWVHEHAVRGITFAGWTDDVPGELSRAALLLAPTPVESYGLAVVEAMAAGVPVVAAGAGGHVETIGIVADAPLFPPGDHTAAAERLRELTADDVRAALSASVRECASSTLSIEAHVDALLHEYDLSRAGRPARRSRKP